MTINHRTEAERIVHGVLNDPEYPNFEEGGEKLILAGLVHAVLARDEEQTASYADLREANRALRSRDYAIREAVSAHIAAALTSKNPERWKAGRDLAQALDKADANIDKAIDSFVSDAGYDPKTVWNEAGAAELRDDPWTPKPDITAEVPEAVQRVLAGHVAEMLLAPQTDDVHQWARGIAFELKRVGVDLTGDIEKRITDLTLGRDPSDPPF